MEAELAKKSVLDLSCSRSRNGVNILGDSDPVSLEIDVQKDVLNLISEKKSQDYLYFSQLWTVLSLTISNPFLSKTSKLIALS